MNGPNINLLPWVTEKFISAAPVAAAKAFDCLATHEALLLLKPLKAEQLIGCLNNMNTIKAAAVLRRFPSRQAAHILSRLSLSQAVEIYKAFSIPQREKMKVVLDKSWVSLLERGHAWPAESAGAQMNRDFVTFKTEMPVCEIIEKLKTMPRKKLPLACLVVGGKEGKLKGLIRTAELAFFTSDSLAGSVMSNVKSINLATPAATAREILQIQPLVPVVDENNVPQGILTLTELAAIPPAKKRFGWF